MEADITVPELTPELANIDGVVHRRVDAVSQINETQYVRDVPENRVAAFLVATSTGRWGKGRTLAEAVQNARLARNDHWYLLIFSVPEERYDEIAVDVFGTWRSPVPPIYQSKEAEPLTITRKRGGRE
jgi:hypothetical protein